MLGLIENKDNSEVKEIYEIMINDFIDETNELLETWVQCIFFLSEAYTEVFYGEFIISDKSTHQCCYRYIPDE